MIWLNTTTGHSLRGVWIEIKLQKENEKLTAGHSLRGVWIEMDNKKILENFKGHSLRGVWIEIAGRNTL